MYAWIWRKLPFGLYGKLAVSAGLISIVVLLLWYIVFPWIEPIMPFDDVQVDGGTGYEVPPEPSGSAEPNPAPGDGFDVPYSEASNAPPPRR